MTTSEVTFTPATLSLRPPRVAILFPDDARWRDWVMRALELASEHWGGAGFILVPHHAETGEPSSHFAEIVRTYDPDHVVVLRVPAVDFEDWYPGAITIQGVASDEERAQLIRSIHEDIASPASEYARGVVASWCSPMRSARFSDDRPLREHESHTAIEAANRTDRYRHGLPIVPPLQSTVFAASAAWRSDLGLFAAARVGVVREDAEHRPEPSAAIVEWTVRGEGATPTDLLYTPDATQLAADAPTVFGAHPGIMQVSRRLVRDRAAVVVGDTGTDFALALAYDRILGSGHWVSLAMLEDPDVLWRLRSSLWWLLTALHRQAAFLTVSSSSEDDASVAAAASMLRESEHVGALTGRYRARVNDSETVQLRPPRLERGFTELVVDEHAGSPVSLPMTVLEDGTLEALSGLDAPVPSTLMYPVHTGDVPYWYVDVVFQRGAMPSARDIPASALLAKADGIFPEVTVRANKEGVSFNPSSLGFVSGGALLPGRLGRPRLRSLSMRAWIAAMAEAEGLGVRVSAAGRQAELVSRRLGSRAALLDLISSANLPALRAFVPRTGTPSKRDPNTVVIGLDPYLSFDAMRALTGTSEGTRELIDSLSTARLLRRGLALGCDECGRLSFVDADQIGHEYECPKCAATNLLTHARWRDGDEPRWYYDLYTPLRNLLEKNGDIPLLAAAHLRTDSRSYSDAPELEFFELESNRPVAEIDLIACVDAKVVLAEAKVTGAYPPKRRGTQTGKLMRIAQVLRADEVILATSRSNWNTEDVAHLEREATAARPFPMTVSTITDLGAD